LGPAGAVKMCGKNDLTCHLTPRTTHPIHHGIQQQVSEMGPMIVVGSAKA
jgi:hypothetical protein